MCGASDSMAELLFVTELWDFYYCPACRHWFQSSAGNPSDARPVTRKGHERALNLLQAERMQQIQAIHSTADSLARLRRTVTLFLAKLYLRISREARR